MTNKKNGFLLLLSMGVFLVGSSLFAHDRATYPDSLGTSSHELGDYQSRLENLFVMESVLLERFIQLERDLDMVSNRALSPIDIQLVNGLPDFYHPSVASDLQSNSLASYRDQLVHISSYLHAAQHSPIFDIVRADVAAMLVSGESLGVASPSLLADGCASAWLHVGGWLVDGEASHGLNEVDIAAKVMQMATTPSAQSLALLKAREAEQNQIRKDIDRLEWEIKMGSGI